MPTGSEIVLLCFTALLVVIVCFAIFAYFQDPIARRLHALRGGEFCQNCDMPIGIPETPHVCEGAVICAKCAKHMDVQEQCPSCGSRIAPKRVRTSSSIKGWLLLPGSVNGAMIAGSLLNDRLVRSTTSAVAGVVLVLEPA